MSGRAELMADGGLAATSTDFFRSEQYLVAEGVSHSVVIETDEGRAALPLIVRSIPAGGRDATSPYGYPGGLVEGEPPDPAEVDWSDTGLVSLFIRDRVGSPTLLGGTERSRIFLHEPSSPRNVGGTFAYHVRRNVRRGFTDEVVPGSEVDEATFQAFARAYRQTMERTNAGQRYFFTDEYLRRCLASPRSWLIVVRAPDGDLAAASLDVLSDGVLHYFLGATADRDRAASPSKNGFVRLLDLADELGTPMNLGGGLRPGDGLEAFKASFSNEERFFVTHEIVCDAVTYGVLSAGHDAGSFFPAYRAPAPVAP